MLTTLFRGWYPSYHLCHLLVEDIRGAYLLEDKDVAHFN
jgi:hypothetical protein